MSKDIQRQQNAKLTSPYKFVTSTEECAIFGELLKASSLAKSVHNDGVTLICPTNEAFDNVPDWTHMLDIENKSDLDAFIEKHVIPEILNLKDFRNGKPIADVNNDPINLDDRDEITEIANDSSFEGITTKNGFVLKTKQLLVIPQLTSNNGSVKSN